MKTVTWYDNILKIITTPDSDIWFLIVFIILFLFKKVKFDAGISYEACRLYTSVSLYLFSVYDFKSNNMYIRVHPNLFWKYIFPYIYTKNQVFLGKIETILQNDFDLLVLTSFMNSKKEMYFMASYRVCTKVIVVT